MSLCLLQVVLASNHTKSSTRFAQALLAWHACSRCARVYVSVARLAREMNIHPSRVKVLLKHLRDAKHLERTGEVDPHGVTVYRLSGGSESATGEGSESATGGVAKACRFCVDEVAKALPNRQVVDRHRKDERSKKCGRDGCTQPQCPHGQQCAYHACCAVCVAEGGG